MPGTETTAQQQESLSSEKDPLLPLPKRNFTWHPSELVNWLSQMVPSKALVGFRQSFTVDGLPNLGPDLASDAVIKDFDKVWLQANQKSQNALAMACFQSLLGSICITAIPRILLSIFYLATPSVVYYMLENMSHSETSSRTPSQLISMTILVFGGQALATALHGMLINRMTAVLRAILIGKITSKNFDLKDAPATKSKALSLINTDVEGIVYAVLHIHTFWLGTVEFGISLYLLSRTLGSAAFLCLLPLVLLIVIVWQLTWQLGRDRVLWSKATQRRVSKTTEVFYKFTAFKMMGLEQKMRQFLESLRREETLSSKAARISIVSTVAALPLNFWFPPIMIIFGGIKFSAWKLGLDPLTLFPVLAYLEVTSDTVVDQIRAIPQIKALLASFARIQHFLALPERVDPRTIRDFSQIENSKDSKSASPLSTITSDTCIAVTNVSVAGKTNTGHVLENVQFSIEHDTLTTITGPVGSGKSLLLKTLMGETVLSSGTIEIEYSKWAYCGQTPWLPDVSVKNVIISDTTFDHDWYEKTLKACALKADIELLPHGEDTKIVSDLVKWTASQKQRIALARAVYSDCSTLICDDIFNDLDVKTASEIFANVFGRKGLLRQEGRTVILATHSVERLKEVDQVIYLKSPGETVVYNEADEIAGFAEYVMRYLPPFSVESRCLAIEDEKEPLIVELETDEVINFKRSSDAPLLDGPFQHVSGRLKWLLIASIAAVAFLERFPNVYMTVWVSIDPANHDYIKGMIALGFASVFCNGFTSWLFHFQIIPKISTEIYAMFLDAATSTTIPFLTSISGNGRLQKFSQEMALFDHTIPMRSYQFYYSLFYALANVFCIAAGTAYTFLLIFPILIALLIVQFLYLHASRKLRSAELNSKKKLFTAIVETASGVEYIRSSDSRAVGVEKTLALLDASQKPFYYMTCLGRWLLFVMMLFTALIATILVSIAVTWTETTDAPSLGLALLGVIAFGISAERLIVRGDALDISIGSTARLKALIEDIPAEEDDCHLTHPPYYWPRSGRIEIKSLSARYGPDDKSPLVLRDVDSEVPHGKIAVVTGYPRSGKSSLLLAMLNLIEMTGSIFIDGVDIATVPKSRLRRAITVIPQDSIQIPGSVRDNITLFILQDESDKARLTEWYIHYVLKEVGLEKHVSLHGGLDAPLSDMKFSPSQRQVFDIARAMLHKIVNSSKLVLIDEVTTEMNYATDKAVQDVMAKVFKGCTRIIVSQRVLFVNDFDAIIPLGKGVMVKADKKSELDGDRNTSDNGSSQPTTVLWVGKAPEQNIGDNLSDVSHLNEPVLTPAEVASIQRSWNAFFRGEWTW